MKWFKKFTAVNWILVALVVVGAAGFASAARKHTHPPFKYEGGTENLPRSCEGIVQIGASALTFKCSGGSVSVPYESIKLMQYRTDVSKKIREMNIQWVVTPGSPIPFVSGHKNKYFAVVYEMRGATRAIILGVPPDKMRPYLAEIDLKAGKRVEVEENEEYE